jgi:hypothetical protein
MRTISVRLSLAEHRLLHDLAGARSVSVETLVREALGLPAMHVQGLPGRRLEIVRSDDASPAGDEGVGPAAPTA